ncbi:MULTISPECIES: hypothetical protein [unclassified Ruegeria]|uniref:hypothetical protein n=1 Tax=unclassified Ruegeria TaxID=2625375 RepID=UPI001489418E|nr:MULTISPECIES: hypothetical protein [unclassified Ruegeria]
MKRSYCYVWFRKNMRTGYQAIKLRGVINLKKLNKYAIGIVLLAFTGNCATAEGNTYSYVFLGEETVLNDIENCVFEIMKQGVEVDKNESQIFHELAQGIVLVYAQKYVGFKTTGKIPASYTEEEAEILLSGEIDDFFDHCFE